MDALPDAVCWYEGMQLLPQHFQLQGLRAELLAARFARAGNPWFWGVSELEVDSAALRSGLVRILALDAVMPDGLPVTVRPENGTALEMDVTAALAESGTASATVLLAVNPLGRNGRVLPLNGRLFSVVSEDAVPDLASGEHPEQIVVWRPNARLVTEAGREGAVCLPLLRVGREGGGYASLPYMPPTPRILPESPLGRAVADLCARTREKCVFLAGRLRRARQAEQHDDTAEIRRQLAALWVRLPEVESMLNGRTAAPDRLYGLLAGMAGAWCALDPLAGVPSFPPLDFLDLQRGYGEVLHWLDKTLERIRIGYRCLMFEHQEAVAGEKEGAGGGHGGFSIQLPDTQTPRQQLVVGLHMKAGTERQAANTWLERAIIASQGYIDALARRRMRGVPRAALGDRDQVDYGVGDDVRLFAIEAAGEWFDPAQKLYITVPDWSDRSGSAAPWRVVLFVSDTGEGR